MSPLLPALRDATHAAHVVLESRLDLMSSTEAQMRTALVRFEAFHRAWEPHVAALLGDEAFLAPRRRVTLLQGDLATLGEAARATGVPDLSFLDTPAAAWGSVYVMEGSTLGGRVIAKALSREAWWPAEGLTYFHPPGRGTAEVWRETMAALEAHDDDRDALLAGASATFHALADWMAPAPDGALTTRGSGSVA